METKLRVGVDSSGAEQGAARAEKALDRLGRKAKSTETQFEKLGGSLGGFRSLVGALGIGVIARQFQGLLDATVTIDNKLRISTKTIGELNVVYDELAKVSERTRTSLEGNAQLFQRVTLATKGLGLSYQENLNLIESFNQALIVGGTNATEARAVVTQFAQGLGSGFKGDELRSIIEQAPLVAEVVSDSLGLRSVQELKKFASEGKITAEVVVNAFREAEGRLAESFKNVNITIGQGFENVRTAILRVVRDFDQFTGLSSTVGRFLVAVGANMETLAGAAAGLAVVLGGALVNAIRTMTVAFLANPLGRMIALFAAAGAAVANFGGQIFNVSGTTASGFEIMRAGFMTFYNIIAPGLNVLVEGFKLVANTIAEFVLGSTANFGSFSDVVKTAFNFILGTAKFTSDAIFIAFENLPATLELIFVKAANAIIATFEGIINGLTGLLKKSAAIFALIDVDFAQRLQKGISDNLSLSLDRIAPSQAAVDAADKYKAALDNAFSVDQLMAFNKEFDKNLTIVKAGARVLDTNLLQNQFAPAATPSADGGGGGASAREASQALKQLQTDRAQFISGLESDFDRLRAETGGATDLVNEWYESQKMQVADLGLDWEEYGDKIDAIFQDKIKEAYLKDLEAADDWASGIERAAIKIQDSIGNAADAGERSFNSVFNNLEDSLTEFVSTGELNFKKFADSIMSELSRIAVQQALIKPLASQFGGSSGGGGGGGLGGIFGSIFGGGGGGGGGLFGLFKEGGISTKPVQSLPAFANGGMTSGGFPAILHPNEAVIPLSRNRKVPVEMGAGGGGNTTVNYNIQTPDADSFRRSQGQIMARTQYGLQRANKRNN